MKRPMSYSTKYLLLALPFVLFVFAFNYVPLFGWIYAFFDYKPGISMSVTPFVGLENFLEIWNDRRDFLRVMRNTLTLSFMGVLGSPLPVVFAIMLNELKGRRFRKTAQIMTTLPNFISWVVVYSLAFSMFGSNGVTQNIIKALGMRPAPINIMGNSKVAWTFQWAIGTWKTLGWNAIIYIAAIASIDPCLYDAAQVDGAGRFQTIMNVTVPGIMPTFFVLLLLSISNMLSNGFEHYFVFYNALTADKLEVLDYYVYKVGILSSNYPRSVALGMFKTVVSVLLLFTANSLSKRVRGESIF